MKKEIENKEKQEEIAKNEFLKCLNDHLIGQVDLKTITKPQTWVMQGDGIFLIHKNKIGYFICKKADFKIPGLTTQFVNRNSYSLTLPKIPKKLYEQTINFFKEVNKKFGASEAFIQFYYDVEKKNYIAHVPSQKVRAASVVYDASQNLNNQDPKRYIFVCEIHSHGQMDAFFSGTDNADEKDTRFFGVIGRLDKPEQTEKFRYLINKEEVLMDKGVIFDLDSPAIIPSEKITEVFRNKSTVSVKDLETLIAQQKELTFPIEWMSKIINDTPVIEANEMTSRFHSQIEENRITYAEKAIKAKRSVWDEETEDIQVSFKKNKQNLSNKPSVKFIGNIPIHLYEESKDVIYNLSEFSATEISEILDILMESMDSEIASMLFDKLIEFDMMPMMEDYVGATYV